jgi:RNA polymerase sigma-70 factor (ECF subfamily)
VDSVGGGINAGLIEACRRGDREAWQALYEAHKDKVYSIAFYFLRGDAAAAADVTQQVFLKLMDDISQFRGGAGYSTWLHRVVVNTCIDAARRQKRSRTVTGPAVLDTMLDGHPSQYDLAVSRELAASVQVAIGQLPPKLRIAILLRYFDDLPYVEMALALHCSVGTVSSRLNRAHQRLARVLAPLRIGRSEGGR